MFVLLEQLFRASQTPAKRKNCRCDCTPCPHVAMSGVGHDFLKLPVKGWEQGYLFEISWVGWPYDINNLGKILHSSDFGYSMKLVIIMQVIHKQVIFQWVKTAWRQFAPTPISIFTSNIDRVWHEQCTVWTANDWFKFLGVRFDRMTVDIRKFIVLITFEINYIKIN